MSSSCLGKSKQRIRLAALLIGHRGQRMEFGAQQCESSSARDLMFRLMLLIGILVRNEAARDALRAKVGEIGLIL